LFPASTRFFAISTPNTSAPARASGIAVVPSPQPIEPPRLCAEGFRIETKIDRIIQKSEDFSQKRLDFSFFLLCGLYF
jgi:hypothetical protein